MPLPAKQSSMSTSLLIRDMLVLNALLLVHTRSGSLDSFMIYTYTKLITLVELLLMHQRVVLDAGLPISIGMKRQHLRIAPQLHVIL